MKQRLAIRVFGILICCVGATLLAIRDWPTYNDTVLGMTAPKVPGEYKKEITVGVPTSIGGWTEENILSITTDERGMNVGMHSTEEKR